MRLAAALPQTPVAGFGEGIGQEEKKEGKRWRKGKGG